MSELTPESKQTIDTLSLEELALEINKGRTSRFQNEKFSYLKTRYELLLAQCEDEHKKRVLELATNANTIAQGSADTAKKSLGLAVVALIVSIIGVAVAYFHK